MRSNPGLAMQNLRTRIKKRKYKLGLRRNSNDGAYTSSSASYTSVESEWQFENFNPWTSTSSKNSSTSDCHHQQHHQQLRCGPKESVTSEPSPPPPPVPPRAAINCIVLSSPSTARPTSWTATCAPPVPLHSWQIRPTPTSAQPSIVRVDESTGDLKRSRSAQPEESQPSLLPVYSVPLRCRSSTPDPHRPAAPQRCPSPGESRLPQQSKEQQQQQQQQNIASYCSNRMPSSLSFDSAEIADCPVAPAVPPHAPGVMCTRIVSPIFGNMQQVVSLPLLKTAHVFTYSYRVLGKILLKTPC